jgi:hypothetical protein
MGERLKSRPFDVRIRECCGRGRSAVLALTSISHSRDNSFGCRKKIATKTRHLWPEGEVADIQKKGPR